jgi:REP element-mobilizing transposase RayT
MAQSLSQIIIHVIFSTKNRAPFLDQSIISEMHEYLANTSRGLGSRCYRVGGVKDHVHLAIDLPRTLSLSKFMEQLKSSSSKWIKSKSIDYKNFAWQGGYGAFSLSFSHLQPLCDYIDNQDEHHQKVSFQDEYLNLLNKLNIEFDPEYIWKP